FEIFQIGGGWVPAPRGVVKYPPRRLGPPDVANGARRPLTGGKASTLANQEFSAHLLLGTGLGWLAASLLAQCPAPAATLPSCSGLPTLAPVPLRQGGPRYPSFGRMPTSREAHRQAARRLRAADLVPGDSGHRRSVPPPRLVNDPVLLRRAHQEQPH